VHTCILTGLNKSIKQHRIHVSSDCICYRLPSDIAELNLTVEKTPRQDVVFIKKNASLFNWHIHETLQLSDNRVDNFETVYSTMVLLFLELGADEVILDIFRLALELQVCCLALVAGNVCCVREKGPTVVCT